jgi:hypothetical protein
MARDWPETPDDSVDPALAPLLDADEGDGEAEFDLAEAELSADDAVLQDTGFDDLLDDSFDYDDYAEADEEGDPNW